MADLTQVELDQLDRLLERVYFTRDRPRGLGVKAWNLHCEMRQRGLTDRNWTIPEARDALLQA